MATEINDGELIECVRKFPSIYDKNHGDYRNKQSKMYAWINISQKMGISEELCEQRWMVLRNRFATELRNKKRNPLGTNRAKSWRYSEIMSFLEEYISPRRTRSSLLVNTVKKRTFTEQAVKSEPKMNQKTINSINDILPEALVTVELGSGSPNNSNNGTTRLRPIAPRPSVSTVTKVLTIPSGSEYPVNNGVHNSFNCSNRHGDCKEKPETEDEDILFGKSIGHTLKTIKNKKVKLQIKSEILSILAKHVE